MKRQPVLPVRLDHPVLMVAGYHLRDMERETEQQRLAALARAAGPPGRSLLGVLIEWLRAGRPARNRPQVDFDAGPLPGAGARAEMPLPSLRRHDGHMVLGYVGGARNQAVETQHELSTATAGGQRTYAGTTIVRHARPGDAAAIAGIYNQAIAARTATFETVPRTARQIEAVLAERGENYPILVVERGDRIVGWAASSPHSERACFAGIADYAVYVASAARSTGVGRAALEALIQECERRGFWKLFSRIFPENTASRALARSLGFREVGVLRCHAQVAIPDHIGRRRQ
jgi:L-amino acid N-acyltransferase YncA